MKTLAAMFTLMGYLLLFFAVVGGIAGMFGYEIKIKGSGMGVMDWGTSLALIVIGIIFWGGGWLLNKRIGKKEKEQQNPGVSNQ